MIRNIVFDIGGVLIRFMPGEAMRKLAIPEEKIAPLLKASVYCKWWQELDRGFFEEEEVMKYMQEDAPEYAQDIAFFMSNGKRDVVEAFECSAVYGSRGTSLGERVSYVSSDQLSGKLL